MREKITVEMFSVGIRNHHIGTEVSFACSYAGDLATGAQNLRYLAFRSYLDSTCADDSYQCIS